jgi:hypothetical protein
VDQYVEELIYPAERSSFRLLQTLVADCWNRSSFSDKLQVVAYE